MNSFWEDIRNQDLKFNKYDKLKHYITHLPTLNQVLNQIINQIFGSGLVGKDEEETKILQDWLFKVNEENATNQTEIKSSIVHSLLYGRSGLLFTDKNVYFVPHNRYQKYYYIKDGHKSISGYVILPETPTSVPAPTKITTKVINDPKYLVIFNDANPKTEATFIEISQEPNKENPYPPLLREQYRLDLLATSYSKLIEDISRDDPGRLIVWSKTGYIESDAGQMMSSDRVLKEAVSQHKSMDKVKAQVQKLADTLRNSKIGDILVFPKNIDKDVLKLDRVTKSTEMLEYLNKETQIICDAFAFPEILARKDYSVTAEQIDDAMISYVVPMREFYMTQISDKISKALGITYVKANRYALKQSKTPLTKAEQVANIIYKEAITAEKTTAENADTAIKTLNELLIKILSTDNGELRDIKDL